MNNPLVSIICISHNHARYVTTALQSVVSQTYINIELVVVDDASTDGSREAIRDFILKYPVKKFIATSSNIGICKSFNLALKECTGKYIIDLAADDVLSPERVEVGVDVLEHSPVSVAIHFSDAHYIDNDGKVLGLHSQRFPHETVPQGDIYRDVIERFFICPPTVMFRKDVIDSLNGYDESLAYEDFDFWIRSSRNYHYVYSPIVLVKKRIVSKSLSSRQFTHGQHHQYSTYRVCEKIFQLNRDPQDETALSRRLVYEIRKAIQYGQLWLALKFGRLWVKNLLK